MYIPYDIFTYEITFTPSWTILFLGGPNAAANGYLNSTNKLFYP